MKRIFTPIVVLLFSINCARIYGQTYDGNALLEGEKIGIRLVEEGADKFTTPEIMKATSVANYCLGAYHMLYVCQVSDLKIERAAFTAMPNNIGDLQLARILEKWLAAHPEKLNQDGVLLIWWALREAYPAR